MALMSVVLCAKAKNKKVLMAKTTFNKAQSTLFHVWISKLRFLKTECDYDTVTRFIILV